MRNSRSSKDRKMRSRSKGRKVMDGEAINTRSVADEVARAIQEWAGDLSAPIKRTAHAAGVDHRTARNYWEAATCPSAPPLIRLMGESEEVLRALLGMAGLLTAEKRERLLDIIAEAEADLEEPIALDPH